MLPEETWRRLREREAPEPVPQQAREIYKFVHSVLRFLHRHVFRARDANAIRDALADSEDLAHQLIDSK